MPYFVFNIVLLMLQNGGPISFIPHIVLYGSGKLNEFFKNLKSSCKERKQMDSVSLANCKERQTNL